MLLRAMVLVAGALGALPAAAFDFTDVFDVLPAPNVSRVAPGPRSLGLPGFNVDPSPILDFDGTVALTYVRGTATDNAGKSYRLIADMRVLRGTYVATDATRKQGSFGFI